MKMISMMLFVMEDELAEIVVSGVAEIARLQGRGFAYIRP